MYVQHQINNPENDRFRFRFEIIIILVFVFEFVGYKCIICDTGIFKSNRMSSTRYFATGLL